MSFNLSGNCIDKNSQPVSGAIVNVFDTATNTLQGSATAASDGSWSASVTIAGPLYAVAYHANSPDIAGTTVNTLMADRRVGSKPTYFILGF